MRAVPSAQLPRMRLTFGRSATPSSPTPCWPRCSAGAPLAGAWEQVLEKFQAAAKFSGATTAGSPAKNHAQIGCR